MTVRNPFERNGITHAVCEVKDEPVGGLDWTSDMFDRNPRHIFPDFAEICREVEPEKEVTEGYSSSGGFRGTM